MIVAGLEGFIKSQYRKFNIRFDGGISSENFAENLDSAILKPNISDNNLTAKITENATNKSLNKISFNLKYRDSKSSQNRDDTAMLKEVLRRRFKNIEKISEESAQIAETEKQTTHTIPPLGIQQLPDLVIIDGGLPQLSASRQVFDELKINIPLVCMAKGEHRNAGEETYYKLDKSIVEIKKGSPLAFYLQRLRDEAHRFAITTHRAKRSKALVKSSLDEVKGIGGKRKKSLLNYFGSTEKIKQASVEDLARVEGISKKVAMKIWEELQK